MSEELHAKWRIRKIFFGWIVDEWIYERSQWNPISIRFDSFEEARLYLHCNALVECAMDGEDWKLL